MKDDEVFKKFKEYSTNGQIYNCMDKTLLEVQARLVNKIEEYNSLPSGVKYDVKRTEILKVALGTYNEGLTILSPVYSNWGLKNVHVGKNCFFNFNTTFVDDEDIYFGDNCLIAPGCIFISATHPISPKLRKAGLQYNKKIHIGNNVWIGAGVKILPGITIGDNCVIGAGSVVTKDVDENTVVVGNPAKVLRKITEKDDQVYDHDKLIPEEIKKKYLK